MTDLIATRTGRPLEVKEYGDPRGEPVFFFHGLIGSHHQAAYVGEQARQFGLRIIAPNRPGVGRSPFVERQNALEAVPDVEDLAAALGFQQFSVIGISGGAPYALACLHLLPSRIRTTTIISGMGPTRLPGALQGMDRRRRVALELGSRCPRLAKQEARRWGERFRKAPRAFLQRLVSTWAAADQALFQRSDIFDLFLNDLTQVFVDGEGPETFAQDLRLYRNYGFSPARLPANHHVTLWQGLHDIIVPPSMAWRMARILPRSEAHFVPGGHFVAVSISARIMARLRQLLDDSRADGLPEV
ncbi:MAG: alpha/beta fold hydrolase [Isosphaeraceae bacterium]